MRRFLIYTTMFLLTLVLLSIALLRDVSGISPGTLLTLAIAITAVLGFTSPLLQRFVVGPKKKLTKHVYLPVMRDVRTIDTRLLSHDSRPRLAWDDVPDEWRRKTDEPIQTRCNELDQKLEELNDLNDEIEQHLNEYWWSNDRHVERTFPEKLTRSSNDGYQVVYRWRAGKPERWMSGYEWAFKFGSAMSDCSTPAELEESLRSYLEEHGRDDELRMKFWEHRCDDWADELLKAKRSSEPTLWEAIEDGSELFHTRDELLTEIYELQEELESELWQRMSSRVIDESITSAVTQGQSGGVSSPDASPVAHQTDQGQERERDLEYSSAGSVSSGADDRTSVFWPSPVNRLSRVADVYVKSPLAGVSRS